MIRETLQRFHQKFIQQVRDWPNCHRETWRPEMTWANRSSRVKKLCTIDSYGWEYIALVSSVACGRLACRLVNLPADSVCHQTNLGGCGTQAFGPPSPNISRINGCVFTERGAYRSVGVALGRRLHDEQVHLDFQGRMILQHWVGNITCKRHPGCC
jgi:hypothetical protein